MHFNENYGQIPIGFFVISFFATAEVTQWRYATKAVTTTANAIYTFALAEAILGTESQIIAAINAI